MAKKKIQKKAAKKSLKAARKSFMEELAKVKTKKVEIRRVEDYACTTYAYARPGAETWAAGYARPYTAKRGAERHFKSFIQGGGRLVFIKAY